MNLFQRIDYFGRRLVAWPLVAFGLLLTIVARGFIRSGAWLADVTCEEES